MRVILYTGKGGVGKTSLAAATAVATAASGKKTIVKDLVPGTACKMFIPFILDSDKTF